MKKSDYLINALLVCLCFGLMSCDNDFEYGSPFRCNFCFDNSIHQDALMAAAVTPYSNTFVRVRKRIYGKINYVILDTKGQDVKEIPITTERENFTKYALGGNEVIVIGFNTLNECLVAYDGMCRYCYEQNGRYISLDWNTETSMVCSKCHKVYNLLMNGICDDENPVQLWQYHVSATSPNGIITAGG